MVMAEICLGGILSCPHAFATSVPLN